MQNDSDGAALDALPPGVMQAPVPVRRLYRRLDLIAAIILSLATVATAWCGYQSALWSGERSRRATAGTAASVQAAKYAGLAAQRLGLHVGLFGQWAAAESGGDARLADFIARRFPEPLRSAMAAWEATDPERNGAAPATPFDVPAYVLPERTEADRWEVIAEAEFAGAEQANAIADRYLLFTIIFASALFFGGISGKFRWYVIDMAVLGIGALTLLVGLAILFGLPTR